MVLVPKSCPGKNSPTYFGSVVTGSRDAVFLQYDIVEIYVKILVILRDFPSVGTQVKIFDTINVPNTNSERQTEDLKVTRYPGKSHAFCFLMLGQHDLKELVV